MKQKDILLQEIENVPEDIIRQAVEFIRFLKQQKTPVIDTALASESALKKNWLSHKEDEAWQDL